MSLVYPDYFPRFSCIAGACTHSCCKGWEIGLDEETLNAYRRLPGEMGKRLAENIEETEAGAFFRLTEEEKCPFLNEQGLCDLIIALGEGALCQICADHPRFRSFFSAHTEIGLGLCCEAAGRLILSWQPPVALVGEGEGQDPEESALLALRRRIFSLLQDRSLPMEARLEQVRVLCGLEKEKRPLDEWAAFLLSLERLEESWGVRLEALQARPVPAAIPPKLAIPFEQLAHYFFYRHLPGALEDGLLAERIAFCLLSVRLVAALCQGQDDLENLIEIARQYSAEIEYSDENLQAILENCLCEEEVYGD